MLNQSRDYPIHFASGSLYTRWTAFGSLLFFLSLAFLASSCKNESSGETASEVLPNTPEEVVRAWQSCVDSNKFEEAKKLSTPSAREVIESIQSILTGGPDGEIEITSTVFRSLSCREEGDIAICEYMIMEEGQEFQDSFLLKRMNGQWLVDIPEEEPAMDEEEIKEIFENMDDWPESEADSLRREM